MRDQRSHYYSFEGGGRGFDFLPMKSWLQTRQSDVSAGARQLELVLGELKLGFARIGWELLLVMDRIYLSKPGDSISQASQCVPAIRQVFENGQPAATEDSMRRAQIFERLMHMELHAHGMAGNMELKVPAHSSGLLNESADLDVIAIDLTGVVAVVEMNVEIATSRNIAHALCYMDEVARSSGKPVFGIMLTQGFHNRLILAARLLPEIPATQGSFAFSFEAAV